MNFRCFECNGPAKHAHHIVPKSCGGTRTLPFCTKCHAIIHDRRSLASGVMIKKGLAARVASGHKLGRPSVIDNKRVNELRKKGMSTREIAREVGCSKTAVHKILKQTSQQDGAA